MISINVLKLCVGASARKNKAIFSAVGSKKTYYYYLVSRNSNKVDSGIKLIKGSMIIVSGSQIRYVLK